jgi:hypothetical protein
MELTDEELCARYEKHWVLDWAELYERDYEEFYGELVSAIYYQKNKEWIDEECRKYRAAQKEANRLTHLNADVLGVIKSFHKKRFWQPREENERELGHMPEAYCEAEELGWNCRCIECYGFPDQSGERW